VIFINMHYLIYKITNTVNHKFYIGKHKTKIKEDTYFGSGLLLERAIKKYGKENFTKEILHEFLTEEEMNTKEAEIVNDQFILRNDTYNVSLGGSGGWEHVNKNKLTGSVAKTKKWIKSTKTNWQSMKNKFLDLIHNDEIFRQKFSDAIKRKHKLYGHPWSGRTHTKESKQKMAAHDRSGSKSPSFGRIWINNGIDNKKILKTESIPFGYKKGRLYSFRTK
jgi:hypothetical protein